MIGLKNASILSFIENESEEGTQKYIPSWKNCDSLIKNIGKLDT